MSNESSNKEIKEFFEQWDLYQKIISNNYMLHEDMLQVLLKAIADGRECSALLDLGCGGADIIVDVLKSKQINKYCGIDLSEIALSCTKRRINPVVDEAKYIQGDFIAQLEKIDEAFDCIVAGYSVHHLSYEEKMKLFDLCYELLSEKGVFIIYDLLPGNESRGAFLDRYLCECKLTWTNMTDREHTLIREHVMGNDFPEPFSTLKTMSERGKYNHGELIYRDKNNLYGAMLFSK